jgi:dephospho-CoA kinase
VRLIGLTGGIASGKSTVARMLASRGAFVIDADVIARSVVEPGKPAFAEIVARFGAGVLAADGSIDRPALAAIVFADEQARLDLNAITHPRVLEEMWALVESRRDTDDVVVADIPLLLESGVRPDGFDAVLVVASGADEQVERMQRDRGMSADDALARIAAQAPMDTKRAAATHVIENSGSIEDLERAVDAFWSEITSA